MLTRYPDVSRFVGPHAPCVVPDRWGFTTNWSLDGPAVQAAVVGGNLEALKWLVENGADVRARGGKWGNVYRAACRNISNEGGVVPWDIVSWLEFHYGRDGWEDDTKD